MTSLSTVRRDKGDKDTLAEIHTEMRGVRSELARLRTLDNALLAERDPEHDWLN